LKKCKKRNFFFPFLFLLTLSSAALLLKLAHPKFENSILRIFNRLLVFNRQKLIWVSPQPWQVKDFFLSDLNHDGAQDLNLVVYKKGRYGNDKPFWVKDDNSLGFHFFILGIADQKVYPLWQSSQVEQPICKAETKDLNDDGHQELVVQEGKYTQKGYSCQNTSESIYRWNGWGFTKQ
jgi:hypothetical protein